MELYHGGRLPDHQTFWPLSHFGTKKAALDRIKVNYEDHVPWVPEKNFLYKCSVDIGSKVVDLADWHAAVPSGIILALSKAGILEVGQRDLSQILQPINDIQQDRPEEALRMVLGSIEHLGISTLRYPNQHEGRVGEFSYCVVNPSTVRVIEYCKIEHND
ncbi:MAG TPA: hypothetical protein VIN05_14100 [Roseovarius sp.]